MAARLAGAAALGAGVGYAAGAGGLRWPRRPGEVPEICGTFRLESPNEDRVSGLVVYEPDGRVSTSAPSSYKRARAARQPTCWPRRRGAVTDEGVCRTLVFWFVVGPPGRNNNRK